MITVTRRATLATALASATAACTRPTSFDHAAAPDHTVRASYVPAGYYWPFLIVERAKLLEERGYALDLIRVNSNSIMINSFLNGNLDVTAQSALTMFPLELQHPGLYKYFYGQYLDSYFFMVRTESTYQRLQDLRGKRIATWQSPTAINYLRLAFSSRGMDPDKDVTIVQIGASSLAPTFENSNDLDAVFGFDVPLARLALTKKFRYIEESIFSDINGGGKIFNGGGVISTRTLLNDRAKADAIAGAFNDAIQLITSSRQAAFEHLYSGLYGSSVPEDPALFGAARLDDFRWVSPNLTAIAQQTYDLMRQHGLIDAGQPLNVRSLFWSKEG